MTAPDPSRWPLAPGRAPAEVEAALAAESAKWPELSAARRDRIARIMRRADAHPYGEKAGA